MDAEIGSKLAELVHAYARAQRSDDVYAQGALNGQDFLAKLALGPELDRGLAYLSFEHGAACHKRALLEQVLDYARSLHPRAISAAGEERDRDPTLWLRAAERHYTAALELDPLCAPARFNRARLTEGRGHVTEAIQDYQAAAGVQPFYSAHANLRCGLAGEARGEHAAANSAFRQAAAECPTLGELHLRCARALRSAGDLEAALDAYGTAVDCTHYYAPEFTQLGPPGELTPPAIEPSAPSGRGVRLKRWLARIWRP